MWSETSAQQIRSLFEVISVVIRVIVRRAADNCDKPMLSHLLLVRAITKSRRQGDIEGL
ncbi:MAG: hypothetical protein IPP76_13000 [Moraxellaceae bacterium]|nr:hypothetical protein [Moraxellaceae bacterium]